MKLYTIDERDEELASFDSTSTDESPPPTQRTYKFSTMVCLLVCFVILLVVLIIYGLWYIIRSVQH
jgi:hypothetical protein